MDRVKEKLRSKFEKIQRSKPIKDGALMANGARMGKFKGSCAYCGVYGHKISQCLKRQKARNDKDSEKQKCTGNMGARPFPFPCFICNKKGHKVSDCPLKKKNREQNSNDTRDEANFVSNVSDVALVCFENIDNALICESGDKEHNFGNLWVGDSGATCHMVCEDLHLIDWKWVEEEITVAGGGTLPVKRLEILNPSSKTREVKWLMF